MLSTPHLVTGAVIGMYVDDPWQIFGLSFMMHFVLDMMPHWDPEYRKNRKWFLEASADLLFGLLLCFWLVGGQLDGGILLGMMSAILPDILTMVIILMKFKLGARFLQWHRYIQNEKLNRWGVLSQIILVIVMSYAILGK